MIRLGIYAGTFDPIHHGHVAFALQAAKVCGLQKVIVLPERVPRRKTGVTDFRHRVAMARLAVADHPQLELNELEDAQFSVSHTLPLLQVQYGDARLVLLVGSDNAKAMNPQTWPGIDRLYRAVDIAVGMRQGHDEAALQDLAAKMKLYFVYTNHPHAAATKVRQGALGMIAPEVRTYIRAHHLYG